jgi:hypothetical protein
VSLSLSTFVSALLVLASGCSTSHRVVDKSPKLPTGTVDTTEPGFDPVHQLAKANDIRAQLVRGGIDCQGHASPPDLPEDAIKLGVVAQLYCTVDGVQVQIAVYRTKAAKTSGISRLSWLVCMNDAGLDYVDGTTWVVAAMPEGTSESDPALTKRVGAVLDAPVKSVSC